MTEASVAQWKDDSPYAGNNASYIEALYEQYLADHTSVPQAWQKLFVEWSNGEATEPSHKAIQERFVAQMRDPQHQQMVQSSAQHEHLQMEVLRLIQSYRLHGHLKAELEPLGLNPIPVVAALTLEAHGLQNHQDELFAAETFYPQALPLRKLVAALEACYCKHIGVEYMHIHNPEQRHWIEARIEQQWKNPPLAKELCVRVLEKLTQAEGLEKYIGAKFPGAKRFSLEGGDVMIPLVHALLQEAGAQSVEEVVIGMAHRGRLNVLVNVFGKKPSELFDEFAGKHAEQEGSGDVKYHQGFSSDIQTSKGPVHIALAFNPSHLEIVTPVVAGSIRARQDASQDTTRSKMLSVAMHGDAAFAGQGVVMEILNMSQTRAYGIGGTLHIVINNQVGFTTSCPEDARSTHYCTDVAKMIEAPVFHVNADDPEAVLFVAKLAIDYKLKFHKDVVIDLVCYRRHGHNEADEPSATQPVMYQHIRKHKTARELYAQTLIQRGMITEAEATAMVENYRTHLDRGDCVVPELVENRQAQAKVADWAAHVVDTWRIPAPTGISKARIADLGQKMTTLPEGFVLQPRVAKIFEDRKKMATGEMLADWGFAEVLAYASLLEEGYPIRFTGQDVCRGTFFHRHAGVNNQTTGERHIPLQHLGEKAATFSIYDSLLSEEAVLAFEYGYASTYANTLVIWEAQFGDFANGAQVVIDQFISSGQQKWSRLCGLTLLLPHGYEGQGPEHSSARLERYLQLCAQQNIQVCVPTTPAQVFHMLRRQIIRPGRKPLVVMSPKSLLRHRLAVSDLSLLAQGSFEPILADTAVKADLVSRVILCSGKVYYDLLEHKLQKGLEDVAIVRIEQLYPFPGQELKALLQQTYVNAKTVVWCQEEPMNQGAWYSSGHHFRLAVGATQTLHYAGRKASASPAVGSVHAHEEEQQALVEAAFTIS